ncbi:PhzF family phenazine biosynthesis protein [Leptospira wolffii]|uniref:PhzF family phenazine biosynthesis protein n=1 Tax=Leptospira wolffii TaxID=409998 RepID=UPI0002F780B5|nr:PhzF family phenazine biosynthesis protein [Leptospira wolffii]EPG65007.1 phenazine biosynthesis-like protein [Leptospira wolffii serovar Khorat str. Khorat-H2]
MKEEYDIYQIDAFTDSLFAGNPAAVVSLKGEWLPDSVLLNIAAENNLSETAFFRSRNEPGEYDLRWFTPGVEVDLCGHATLATAFAIYELSAGGKCDTDSVRFHTASGVLEVFRDKDTYFLDFPSRAPKVSKHALDLSAYFNIRPSFVEEARDILFVFEKESDIRNLIPNHDAIRTLPFFAAIVTAPADPDKPYDFVSRFFAPAKGVPEDPVTGSAHCTLIPYWASRLQKKNLVAYQASQRGGVLLCEDRGERVRIGGKARLFLEGKIRLE